MILNKSENLAVLKEIKSEINKQTNKQICVINSLVPRLIMDYGKSGNTLLMLLMINSTERRRSITF